MIAMNQLTFEAFPAEEAKKDADPYLNYAPVLVLKDINVAWTDRNWYLHEQDLVYLDEKLATILIDRGIAKKTEVH